MEGAIIPIAVFIAGAVIIFTIMYFKYKARSDLQVTIRQAIEKGNELTPELLERMSEPKQKTSSDLRRGMIAIAIGIAFALFGIIIDEQDAVRPLIGIGMFPTLVGIAYLVLWRTSDRENVR